MRKFGCAKMIHCQPQQKMRKLLAGKSSKGGAGDRASVSIPSSPVSPMISNANEDIKEALLQNRKKLQEQQEEQQSMSTGDDFILASLVESGFITGSIKTVYERGKEETFYESLDTFLDKQRVEIENICSANYEEFLKSVSQLKSVRNDGKQLKKKIISLNDEVQKAGREALDCGKKLVEYRNIAENIHLAVQVIDLCKHVSSLSTKVHEQIQDKKYFSALKTLDSLEKSVRTVHKFSFAQYLEKQIPIFKRKIKQNVERDFNQWLVNAKNRSQDIGRSMIEKQFNLMNSSSTTYLQFVSSNDFNMTFPTSTDIITDTVTVFDVLEQFNVELTPVYTCKHIYESMDSYEQFKGYYKRNRTIQLNHEISHPPLLEQDDKSAYRRNSVSSSNTNSSTTNSSIYPSSIQEWLERIIGFFTVESVTLRTTSSLLSNIELNAMWEQSLQQIVTTIDEHLAIRMNNPKEYLKMKKVVLIFSLTASEQLGLHTSLLVDLLAHYRSAFSGSIEFKASENIENSDCRQPYVCNRTDSPEFKNLKKFNLIASSSSYIPFSETILTTCVEIENFILDYEVYCDRIVSYTTSIKQLKDGICKLFECAIKCLDQELHSSTGTGIARYVQIAINYQFMVDCVVPYFEDMYGRRVKSSGVLSNNTSVNNTTQKTKEEKIEEIVHFKDLYIRMTRCKERGEDLILKEVLERCKKALSLSETTVWAPEYQTGSGVIGNIADNFKNLGKELTNNLGIAQQQQPQINPFNEPHPFVLDLITYLDNTAQTIQYLKPAKRDQILYSTCDFVGRYFKDILSTTKIVNEITMKGLLPLQKDIQRFLKWTADLKVENCTYCFTELNYVLTFLFDEKFNEETFATYDEDQKAIVEHGGIDTGLISKFDKKKDQPNLDATLLKQTLSRLKNSRIEFLKRTYLKKKIDLKNLFVKK